MKPLTLAVGWIEDDSECRLDSPLAGKNVQLLVVGVLDWLLASGAVPHALFCPCFPRFPWPYLVRK